MKEIDEQLAVMVWKGLHQSEYPDLCWLAHIANEGTHIQGSGHRKAALGVQKGVPDFVLPVPRGGYAGLWIELKRPGEARTAMKKAVRPGLVKPEQQKWLNHLNQNGYLAKVCYGAVETITVLVAYLELR